MIGRNVIGKIYRPEIVNNFDKNKKNGFLCKTKVKSNFGHKKEFELIINLNEKTNKICIESSDSVLYENTNELIIANEKYNTDISAEEVIKPDCKMNNQKGQTVRKSLCDGVIIPILFRKENKLFCTNLNIYISLIDFYDNEKIILKIDDIKDMEEV